MSEIDTMKDKKDNKNEKITKDSDKYKILLKLLNKILKNIGKNEINDITKFINIDRDDIIKDVNKKALDDMQKELFKLYNKKNCGYYNKSSGIVLNCVRGMIKEAGYEFEYEKKEEYKMIDGVKYRKTLLLYTIK